MYAVFSIGRMRLYDKNALLVLIDCPRLNSPVFKGNIINTIDLKGADMFCLK